MMNFWLVIFKNYFVRLLSKISSSIWDMIEGSLKPELSKKLHRRNQMKFKKVIERECFNRDVKFHAPNISDLRSQGQLINCFLCTLIICIPTTCIFIGLAISSFLSPMRHQFPSQGVIIDSTLLNYSWYNSHNLTINFVGGLGNQMFQYAALYGIAKANGLKPIISEDSLLEQVFSNLKCQVETNNRLIKNFKNEYEYLVYYERKSNAFDSRTFSLNFMKNIRITGYFQSWRYFDHARTDIRKQFSKFGDEITKDVSTFLKTSIEGFMLSNSELFHKSEIKLVGVHVRRGDFLNPESIEKGYTVADKYYFRRAMNYFAGKFKNIIFIICSDDMGWVEKNIKSTSMVVYSPFNNSPQRDLKLLISCNHTIISGGSFGWWGAWLADGLTIYSQRFPKPDSKLSSMFRFSDYYLPQWISM